VSNEDLDQLRSTYLQARDALHAAQKKHAGQPVGNYDFDCPTGPVSLIDLFADKSELFMIHNMGKSCAYCTLWADGFNGVLDHLQNRAAVVVSSPDPVDVQQQFKEERQWKFTMVSVANNQFAEDMGYYDKNGPQPGVSVFSQADGKVTRVADAPFGPGDDFCSVWHLFNLLPDGTSNWQPKFKY